MQIELSRDLARFLVTKLTHEEIHELIDIPIENIDLLEAYANGDDIYFVDTVSALMYNNDNVFSAPRDLYFIA